MLKDYLHKIRKTIDDTQKTVLLPYETFYTGIKICSTTIPPSEITPNIIESMANIYKFYRSTLAQNTHQINFDKLHSQLSDLFLPFRKYAPQNPLCKLVMDHLEDIGFLQQIEGQKMKADQLIKLFKQKGNKIHVKGNHYISYTFWVMNFKADYAVHFDIVWKQFYKLMESSFFYRNFVNESSKERIKSILDPDNKYCITSANVNQLFIKMSEPQFLQELLEEASLKKKPKAFKTASQIKLIFRKAMNNSSSMGLMNDSYPEIAQINCNFPQEEVITINGQQISTKISKKQNLSVFGQQQLRVQNKFPPTIRFGSLTDNQFCLKVPYVSRRQFMIIEESGNIEKALNLTDSDSIAEVQNIFSLVCLSPSNYTSVVYNRRVEATVGMIFKIDGEIIEITNICEEFSGIKHDTESLNLFTVSEEQPTLEYLPHLKSVNTMQTLTYMFLNGKNKNMKETCNSLNNQITLGSGMNFSFCYTDNKFYLPGETEILAKNSNQIISGHMSHKIQLESNMRIKLEGYEFQIISIGKNGN